MNSKKNIAVEAASDGACSGNPGPGGWGGLIIFDDKTEIEMTTGGSAKSMLTVPEISEFKKDEDGMTLNPLRKMY